MSCIDGVRVGDVLPDLVKAPDRLRLVQYAAGSGDFNPFHYDPDFPQARDVGDNIVHGRLKYAALGELVALWLDHRGRILRIACRYRGMDLCGRQFVCRGIVSAVDLGERRVELDLWTEDPEGARTTVGSATVEFFE